MRNGEENKEGDFVSVRFILRYDNSLTAGFGVLILTFPFFLGISVFLLSCCRVISSGNDGAVCPFVLDRMLKVGCCSDCLRIASPLRERK